jgi:hypothetical protein
MRRDKAQMAHMGRHETMGAGSLQGMARRPRFGRNRARSALEGDTEACACEGVGRFTVGHQLFQIRVFLWLLVF